MRDLIVILVTLAFFGLCLAYVRWCDHILGPDEDLAVSAGHDQAAPSAHVEDTVAS